MMPPRMLCLNVGWGLVMLSAISMALNDRFFNDAAPPFVPEWVVFFWFTCFGCGAVLIWLGSRDRNQN